MKKIIRNGSMLPVGIKISTKGLIVVGDDKQVKIDARLLHQMLNSGQKYIDWIKSRIQKYGFKKDEDFFINLGRSAAGRNTIEYFLTFDMGKELSMIENNETGRNIRRYFIEKEKEANHAPLLGRDMRIPTGLDRVRVNGRTLLPYSDFLREIGLSKNGGSYYKQRVYPNHFIRFNDRVHLTEEMAFFIMEGYRVYLRRKQVKSMQPVLPLDFGEPLKLAL